MSDVVLLRKLALKSFLTFGKFSDLTVNQCIETRKKSYLRWVYFNCSNITFLDDILDEIKIPLNFRFDKPNKNTELGKKLEKELRESYPEWFEKKIAKRTKKILEIKVLVKELKDDKYNSKLKLMNRNHGH